MTRVASHRFDLFVSVATLGTCVMVIALAVASRISGPSTAYPDVLVTNSALPDVDGVSFAATKLTLLVGLQSTCNFCAQSMPALQQLNTLAMTLDGDLAVLAVGPEQPRVLGQYLKDNGLSAYRHISVGRESPLAPVAHRTPSLVLVDQQRRVRASWSGVVSLESLKGIVERIDVTLKSAATDSGR